MTTKLYIQGSYGSEIINHVSYAVHTKYGVVCDYICIKSLANLSESDALDQIMHEFGYIVPVKVIAITSQPSEY